MEWLTVVGARPQFVKAAAVARALSRHSQAGHPEVRHRVLHTGQHYDDEMSAALFRELELDAPEVNLGVGSASHGRQTAAMLEGIEAELLRARPDVVLVYGDTNSTLAAALAACKLHVPIAHVEAGLRSYNRLMPEEINRVLTDQLSSWLFVPSGVARENLAREGIHQGVHLVGDVMHDVLLWNLARAPSTEEVLGRYGVRAGEFIVATVHRAETTDEPTRLRSVFAALRQLAEEVAVLLPLHPRTRDRCQTLGISFGAVRGLSPIPHGELLRLEQSARAVLTDSGGMQKEAYWLGTPCVTLRNETEWVETVARGWNVIAGTEVEGILDSVRAARPGSAGEPLYGRGNAADQIVAILSRTNA